VVGRAGHGPAEERADLGEQVGERRFGPGNALSDRFIAYMLMRNSRLEADLIDQLFNSSEKRLARTLLLLARFGNGQKPQPILPALSQEMLAEMIGTTRSRVNFFLNKFRKLGFITYDAAGLTVNPSLLTLIVHD